MTNRGSTPSHLQSVSQPLRSQAPVAVANEEDHDEAYYDYFYDEPGAMPGTLIIDKSASPSTIVLIDYNEQRVTNLELPTPEACAPYLDSESVSWVDVKGLGSEDVLRRLGTVFNLHPLILEDVVNVPQRPKVDENEDQLLLITRMVIPEEDKVGFYTEQVSFILGKQYLLTVQEEPERDTFEPIRDRICNAKGILRSRGADALAYALLDTIIDGFFPVLENYGERLEDLEDEVIAQPTYDTLQKIYAVRRELLTLRRAIWPQRDTINALIRDGSHLISDEVRIYLRDCYDHSLQVLDMVETYRELASSLMDVYLSSVSNRMNEIMKLLTVISSIFIPLTFIAGVYGMNFNPDVVGNMPELNTPYAYWICWGVMLAIGGVMVFFFWRRGWFANFSTVKKE